MPPRIVDGFGFACRVVSRIVCSICSIDNITSRTTLRNQEDAKGQRLKQSRPTFAAQEDLVDSAEEGNSAAMRFPSAISASAPTSARLRRYTARDTGPLVRQIARFLPHKPRLTLIRRTPCLIHEGALRKAAAQLGARSRGRAPPGMPPRRGALRSPTREACQLGICQLNFLLEIAPSWTKTVDM